MDEIRLIPPTAAYAVQIAEYRAEFPSERMRVTLDPERIPGMDYLEDFGSVTEWLDFCEGQDIVVHGGACLRWKVRRVLLPAPQAGVR